MSVWPETLAGENLSTENFSGSRNQKNFLSTESFSCFLDLKQKLLTDAFAGLFGLLGTTVSSPGSAIHESLTHDDYDASCIEIVTINDT